MAQGVLAIYGGVVIAMIAGTVCFVLQIQREDDRLAWRSPLSGAMTVGITIGLIAGFPQLWRLNAIDLASLLLPPVIIAASIAIGGLAGCIAGFVTKRLIRLL